MSSVDAATSTFDVADDVAAIDRDGIVGRKAAFDRGWVDDLHDDLMTAFWAAIQRPHGTIGRGRRRWYVEVHPEQLRGFVELVTHPWVTSLSAAVLGPDYRFVEVGFDVPFQGARDQPWHRDFPAPVPTIEDRRLTSLAFNVTAVDTTQDMGPFEIAPGTHWDDGRDWPHGMFPERDHWDRYATLGVRRYPERGDISARSGLAIHRGTAHASPVARPVLILGVVAGDAANPEEHDLRLSRDFESGLSDDVRRHLLYRAVDTLEPITQRHDIEGLMMGDS
jgi:hypothetical protein